MKNIKVMVPAPRITVYDDISLPALGLSLRASTVPPDFGLPGEEFPHSDTSVAMEFVDGAHEQNLSETITAFSGVDESDFCRFTTLHFEIESDLFQAQGPRRVDDEALLRNIIEHADHLLDGIRIDYCRLDLPQMCIGTPGYILAKNMYAAYVFDPEIDDGRIIAREPEVPVAMPGIGLDFDSISPSFVDPLIINAYPPDSVGVRLKRLLRTYANTLSSTSDESKILTLLFALDGILTPERSTPDQFKRFIAVSASTGSIGFQRQYDQFVDFYANVRNPLVHRGKSYSGLGRTRKTDLLYLQFLVSGLLESMLAYALEPFEAHWQRMMTTANTLLRS